ncbi:MaoC/PaaZ C-terminal domain-containing protein [Streptomyces sp. NRRL S-31]|uniref:MaoC family dehydratase n=1 Tax=Streptomyces sp. NRRL S-31 TaxID=1463898 RepID=UPI0004CC3A18|nr:MaoC/PaaZ C-terminal domain-containing protein [Streptomyces sp. NRRL S-31]
MADRQLNSSPALGPLLLRGALRSPFKRPAPGAGFPRTRLLLPGLRIDLARLAAYERVCGFPTGEPDLPVTYPHVLGFPLAMRLMSRRDFPLPLLGLVHTSLSIERAAALRADGEYDLSVWIEGLTAHRRGTEATVATALRRDGGLVWSSRSTYLARHGTAPGRPDGDRHAASPRTPDDGTGGADGDPVMPVVAEWAIGADVGRRYGAASGDRNPIHLHPLTARLFGFPRAVAHGMWTVARCLAAHGTPDAAEVRARFRAPVPLPGTVAYGADGDGRFALRGPDGGLHLSGEVRPLPVRNFLAQNQS